LRPSVQIQCEPVGGADIAPKKAAAAKKKTAKKTTVAKKFKGGRLEKK